MKRIIAFILSVTICLSTCLIFASAASAPSFYSTIGVATSNTIEMSKSVLDTAKANAKTHTGAFSVIAYISQQYQTHIYHFVAPQDGYYAFYTTGSLDTVIRVYEEQSFLCFSHWYDEMCDPNDDGGYISSNIYSSSLTLLLDGGEDYYVCVRGWSRYTGSYNLHVEGNEDKVLISRCPSYTKWDLDSTTPSIFTRYNFVESKQYLTPYDAICFYWSLSPATADNNTRNIDYIYNAYDEGPQKAIQYIQAFLSGITIVLPESIPYAGAIEFTLDFANFYLSIFDYLYKQRQKTPQQMMDLLYNICGVVQKPDGSWTAHSGLLIQKTRYDSKFSLDDISCGTSATLSTYEYSFTAYNDSIRKGELYDKGHWES